MPETAKQATPRPWRSERAAMVDERGAILATAWAQDSFLGELPYRANAELIVKAVNNFDELVEALELLSSRLRNMSTREASTDIMQAACVMLAEQAEAVLQEVRK